ncbi:3-dehydroquinate synthase [Swingsia samuiensis]|uniref:Multifunctional fusion protein n=1 Tax=Swingsia samuiensis TaxID=1293412 RepID=A0A4Y6UIW4_9PROT|nr:3-dehydroquinate synthase [Swingsia samuiensis]QDH17502.1 3-dehydroquinate synthase [Swingsia samuiensis]
MSPLQHTLSPIDGVNPLHISKTIVLIGMMGAGKTTIGRRLAHVLNLPFVDADAEIERAAGCTIPEIFTKHGESFFRKGERRVIQRLIKGPPCILATGGGAWMDPQTRDLVRKYALSIWLRVPIDVLIKRVSGRHGRPLLAQGDLHETMTRLVAIRYPIYAEADIIIDCGEETVDQGVKHVHNAIADYQAPLKVNVTLSQHTYDVLIGPDLITRAGSFIAPRVRHKHVVIITNETVAALHLSKLQKSLEETGIRYDILKVPDGEESKSLACYSDTISRLLALGIERNTTILAFGGGVTGDLSGFIAATALRGIPFIQIPTTLLAQVDSSVGGKTGINSPSGKNLIGAFHQPVLVLADNSILSTLPRRQLVAGYAEILKAGVISSMELFEWCEKNGQAMLNGDPSTLAEGVRRACAYKAGVVATDEREQASQNGRALLNLGHTFGHALEAELGYDGRILHGEGVSIGLHLAMALSVQLGYAPASDLARLDSHLRELKMPTSFDWFKEPFSAKTLIAHMQKDKKIHNGKITFILLQGIGKAFTSRDVSIESVEKLLLNEGCLP